MNCFRVREKVFVWSEIFLRMFNPTGNVLQRGCGTHHHRQSNTRWGWDLIWSPSRSSHPHPLPRTVLLFPHFTVTFQSYLHHFPIISLSRPHQRAAFFIAYP